MQSLYDLLKIENTYERLFPKRETGLVLFRLYDRLKNSEFPKGVFTEEDIQQAFREVTLIHRDRQERFQWEYSNSRIMELQEFYLLYDDVSQTYMFKDLGLQVAEAISRVLFDRFKPTIIEIICTDLHSKLKEAITEQLLEQWLTIELVKSKTLLMQQVDYLNQQIDRSVKALSKKAKLRKVTLPVALEQIEEEMNRIRKQNEELRTAFRRIDWMNDILVSHPVRDSNEEIDDSVRDTISYFEGAWLRLKMIDSRIDKIQPKIKQFFASLNRDMFNLRVGKFLDLLLEKSNVSGKELEFPFPYESNILLADSAPSFLSVESPGDLFPPIRKQRPEYKKDTHKEQEAHRSGYAQLMRQQRVQNWLEAIRRKSLEEDEIHLTAIFFTILEKQDDDLQLAVQVIDQAVKIYKDDPVWKVYIDKNNRISSPGYKHTISDIWMKRI